MIKTIISSAAIVLLLASCNKTNVNITGHIKEAGKQKIYLEQLNVDNTVIIDSTESNKNGEFKFKTFVEQPTFYNVKVGPREAITFIAEADENIELSGSFKGLSQNYWVDGSENSLWVKLLNFQLNNTVTQLDSLRNIYTNLAADKTYDTERHRLLQTWDSIINKQIKFSKDFILKHAVSPASYYALYQKFKVSLMTHKPLIYNLLFIYNILGDTSKRDKLFEEAYFDNLSSYYGQLISGSENILTDGYWPLQFKHVFFNY